MALYPHQNLGAATKSNLAGFSQHSAAAAVVTAAGNGDNVKVTGETVDCLDAHSGVLDATWAANLTDAKSLTIACELQESSDDSSWDTAEVVYAATTVATSDGGTTEHGVTVSDIDLSGRKRYIRFNITPNLDAGATDTAI